MKTHAITFTEEELAQILTALATVEYIGSTLEERRPIIDSIFEKVGRSTETSVSLEETAAQVAEAAGGDFWELLRSRLADGGMAN